ncbi:aminotransferase class I/II-fold pyridoxal phosphate-dependent enzyme [Hymenobacter sp. BT491]|uniref:aminotransferase class I/II-fold pyridoxal phosphate-dependent enzyme n=1 Tax=Hymenobacter sp. BT491 TaxID=2766779 RepID=UPI0016534842|nr:aminotransferase class I/II-fold pyridoxal phosphate-dependent enzyme [Hymenobacter sp. BT491]MBC6991834.1 aminotransferase class I/II-fold pyridoxal phosphate-dependent enzyme [Hymenobacter sp. BT491]
MLQIDQLPGRTILADGREYLFCSGTSYLGMARNAHFQALLLEGMQHYGTNYSSSRISNLQLRIYDEAEHYLARYTGAEAALTVSSGYLAGQMAVKALAHAGRFEYAPGTHPAAWLTTDLPAAPALSYPDWASALLTRLAHEPAEPVVIISNSLDPLRVQRYDFSWVSQLPRDRPITLLIDDSHGFGVTGVAGAGIISELRVPEGINVLVISSLGKACGIPGGVVLGSQAFIGQLRQSAFFAASSPVVPAYLHAFVRAGEIYREARAQLAANVQQLAEAVQPTGMLQSFNRFPVSYISDNQIYEFMLKRGVWISSFPYPSPTDPCITRIVLSALHTSADVARVAELVTEFASTTS